MNAPTKTPGKDSREMFLSMTALEHERKRQREQTLQWISIHALQELRKTWRCNH
jgi:hypothetical protein